MIKFIAISFLLMTLGCYIVDKIEELISGKELVVNDEVKDNSIDIETLDILKNYGLINIEQYKCNLNSLNKV